MTTGAIILCGGRSSRMERDKALLPVDSGEVMLQRVVRLVSTVMPSERIVCVAAPGQELPALAAEVRVVRDPWPHGGPLVGLAVGLRELRAEANALFVCACDVPLLVPAFVTRMFDLLGDFDAVALQDDDRWHPLGAVYRSNLLPIVEERLAGANHSLVGLLESLRTRRVHVDDVRDVDPKLRSLANCNTAEEYWAIVSNEIER